MNIVKQKILNIVEKVCPNKYTSKYNSSYYLDYMIMVLKDITSWSSLGNILDFFSKISFKKYHYKTIYNVFLKWSHLGIFKRAYEELLLDNIQYNIHSTIDLFIDTTTISNKNGIEDVNYGQNKKKKTSKISFICNSQKKVLSVSIYKGSEFDVKTIEKSIDNLVSFKYRKINLIGDKGYIQKDIKHKLKTQKINLIYPKRKNQKIKTTKYEKIKLKKRYNVEHLNQKVKQFDRMSLRKDRINITFISNIYLSLLVLFF